MTLLLAAALVPPLPAPSGIELALQVKAKRTWTIELPADPFHKLSGAFPIEHANGQGFAIETRGVGLAVDTDGDGSLDRVVEGREHPETKMRQARIVLTGARADGSTFKYPVRLESRGNGWLWASSAVATGDVDGTSIEVIDLDGNGRFGDVGTDALVVGGTGVAQFLGRTISVDGKLHQLSVDGGSARLSAYEGETGTLDVHGAFGGKGVLLSAVVKSVDGQQSFELSSFEDGLVVPTGSYYVAAATLGLGDARVVCDPEGMDAVRVTADAEAQVAWGAPLNVSFSYARSGAELMLDPTNVHYVGRGGERWTGWNPIGKSPTFHVKDAETGDVLVDAVFPGSC